MGGGLFEGGWGGQGRNESVRPRVEGRFQLTLFKAKLSNIRCFRELLSSERLES